MKNLKSKIETFNFVKLKMSSRWIARNNIDNKTHSSIVIILNSAEDAQTCKNKLNINGIKIKTDKFNSIKPFMQCQKCMKFKHIKNNCRNKPACFIFGQKHEKNQHKCHVCETMGKLCMHMTPKCVNCNEKHCATNKNCKITMFQQFRNSTEL